MNFAAWVDVAAEEAAEDAVSEDAVHSAMRARQSAKSMVHETSY